MYITLTVIAEDQSDIRKTVETERGTLKFQNMKMLVTKM